MQRSLFVLLLVEDNPAEVGLLKEALKRSLVPVQLCTVSDGTEALAFLYHADRYNEAPCPNLIVLDLNCGNLPELNGQAVLARLKTDVTLKQIPVVVFHELYQARRYCAKLCAGCQRLCPQTDGARGIFCAGRRADRVLVPARSCPQQRMTFR